MTPKCKRPLVYFSEGELAGRWLPDDDAERRRRHEADDAGL